MPFLAGSFQPYALLPLTVTAVAFILSFLLVFAGNKPGFMSDYAVFTLNTSRIGENLVESFDNKINGLNFSSMIDVSDITKRTELALDMDAAPVATATEPTITIAARVVDRGIGSDIMSDLGAAGSAVGGKATAAASAVESKASSVGDAVTTKIDSALAKAESAIVQAVNEAYGDLMKGLDLKDFYSIYMMTSCEGTYEYPNGTNITVGDLRSAPSNDTKMTMVADSCKQQSALDPVGLVRILYEISIVVIGLTLLLGILGVVSFSRKVCFMNVLASVLALLFVGIASAAVNGVAVGAATLINFIGEEIGVSGEAGYKFIAMSWATVILLLVNAGLWSLLAFVGHKLRIPTRRPKGEKHQEEYAEDMQEQ